MSQFNISDAKSHFSELVQKAMLGEEVIIAKKQQAPSQARTREGK